MAAKKKTSAASKNSAKVKSQQEKKAAKQRRPIRREVSGAVCIVASALVLLGLFQVDAVAITILTAGLRALIGAGVYVMPFALALDFVILMFHDGRPVRLRVASTFVVSVCIGILVHLLGCKIDIAWEFPMVVELWNSGIAGQSGGLIAGFLAMFLELIISKVGAVILCVVLVLLGTIYAFNMSIGSLIKAIRNRPRAEYAPPSKEHPDAAEALVNHVATRQIERSERKRTAISEFDLPVDEPPAAKKQTKKKDPFLEELKQAEELRAPQEEPELLILEPRPQEAPEEELPEAAPLVIKKQPELETEPEELLPLDPDMPQKVKKEEAQQEAMKIASEIAKAEDQPKPYTFPSLHLLSEDTDVSVDGSSEMQANAERINNTLMSFGIDAHIINVIRGSSITRYELELSSGVRLNRITNLADDIALALGASGVRISAIPDKISVVGIEVPNKLVSTVRIRDVISSPEFGKSKSKISFAVGKDIGGKCVVGDIAKLPHMLIAGTTGSGKSVCMNSLIISMLYKAKPEEVRMIMIDPKMVELGIYNGIPHLLIPVVTDPKKAAGALQWAVTEMMKRYRLMADAGVHDLEAYNKFCENEDGREKLPQIVVFIDELADLMLVAAKEVEESICRVAQMGRASGIHLVIATQRPSADVITGLMKANIPSRIAFAVASAMESRIILDATGAEKLVGKGDMLFAPLGQGKPRRVQGCFITDDEVRTVVGVIKENALPSYDDEVMEQINKKAEQSGKASASAAVEAEAPTDGDELLPAAVEVFLETGQGSVSMLQRRLKLGYARAARIVDEMEEKGIVGPFEGSKPRQILITKEQWQQMQGLAPELPEEEDNLPVEEELF